MEETHEGRRSPYGRLRRTLEGPVAEWAAVERMVAGFEPMRRALAESPVAEIKESADGYIDALKGLGAAVAARDDGRLRKAFQNLSTSCGDCHFKGGVGGSFEHEHEHEHEDEHEDEDEDEKQEKSRVPS